MSALRMKIQKRKAFQRPGLTERQSLSDNRAIQVEVLKRVNFLVFLETSSPVVTDQCHHILSFDCYIENLELCMTSCLPFQRDDAPQF